MTSKEFKEKYDSTVAEFKTNTDPAKGIVRDESGTYFGSVVDGTREGYGRMFYGNGDYYEGNWMKNLRHGGGVLDCADNRRFDGNFLSDRFAEGEMIWPYGERYSGKWKNGKPDGEGRMLWPNGSGYSGHWKNGVFHGIGHHWVMNHLKVTHGTWVDGKPDGRCIVVLRNGNTLIAFYKGGIMHGPSTEYNVFGDTVVGQWVDGKREGDFIRTDKDGKKHLTTYKDGTAIAPEEPIGE